MLGGRRPASGEKRTTWTESLIGRNRASTSAGILHLEKRDSIICAIDCSGSLWASVHRSRTAPCLTHLCVQWCQNSWSHEEGLRCCSQSAARVRVDGRRQYDLLWQVALTQRYHLRLTLGVHNSIGGWWTCQPRMQGFTALVPLHYLPSFSFIPGDCSYSSLPPPSPRTQMNYLY